MKNIRNSLVSTSLVIFSCLFCVYSQFTASEINKLKSHYSIKELQQQSRLLNELDEDTLEVSDTFTIGYLDNVVPEFNGSSFFFALLFVSIGIIVIRKNN